MYLVFPTLTWFYGELVRELKSDLVIIGKWVDFAIEWHSSHIRFDSCQI